MDDETAEAYRALGLDPKEVQKEWARQRRNPLGPIRDLLGLLRGNTPNVTTEADPWERDAGLVMMPFADPLPVQLVGEMDLDPLEFTVEMTRAPTAVEIAQMTAWLGSLGKEESKDDDDHVSNWSGARPSLVQGAPAIAWHFDAALASPSTVRRIIEKTLRQLSELGLPARRLLVGHLDQMRG